MIDFTNSPILKKAYAGANGKKIAISYNNQIYMLKFPSLARFNDNMSYANSCISEYLGSHIFEIAGIPVQETLLGTYRIGQDTKVVVACKDFTANGLVLQDFASLKNTVISSPQGGYGTELFDVLSSIDAQGAIDPIMLKDIFWDIFIVDAFIGNWDRHNGNWGFLYNSQTDDICLAPIYDCGSCLYPQADEKIMQSCLSDAQERMARVFNRPVSAFVIDGQRINYFDYISSLKNPDCNAALKRIVPRLDLDKINSLIDNTPYISSLQKTFYKTMLAERKHYILDKPLLLLQQKEIFDIAQER